MLSQWFYFLFTLFFFSLNSAYPELKMTEFSRQPDWCLVNGAKDSVAPDVNSVAGIVSTQKVRFLAEDARAAQNVAVKASLATSASNGGDVMYGAGMNLEW